jgi:hypothetical protein
VITQIVVVDSVTVTVPVGSVPGYSGLIVAVRSSAGSSSKATVLRDSEGGFRARLGHRERDRSRS